MRKNQVEKPDRKGHNQEQHMGQETMGNQWAIEKVQSFNLRSCMEVNTAAIMCSNVTL